MGYGVCGDFQGGGATRVCPRLRLTEKKLEQGAGNAIKGNFGGLQLRDKPPRGKHRDNIKTL